MGKKKGKDKKGKGAEKTAQKTERNAEKKAKKILKEKGEEDIEALIQEFQAKDKKMQETVTEKCPPPSPRCNMSLTPHPTKDELLMFGGEYFNGQKTYLYNDLFIYNIKNNDWTKVTAPGAPPPRCAHQAVSLPQGGGQLWIFGGEFASPTQSQFYHYKDLWVFHVKEKTWRKISAPKGPSARSGHRMTVCNKQLIVFGGFHDNARDYKYYNDIFAFDLESYTWTQLEPSGSGPLPRSACVLTCTEDQKSVVIYGGYSKEKMKKEIDLGKIHTDMFMLTKDTKKSTDSDKWKWVSVKQHGIRPSQRCGCSLIATPGNRALVFGGVYDEDEDEEDVEGVFYNDMYHLELDKGRWHQITLRGKKDASDRKRKRRKNKDGEEEGSDLDEEMEEVVEGLTVSEDDKKDNDTSAMETSESIDTKDNDDDPFKVTVGPQSSASNDVFTVTVGGTSGAGTDDVIIHRPTQNDIFQPCPRMNALLAVKNGILYLYGGVFEDGDKQITLADFYSLDLHKLEEWKILIKNEADKMEWLDSESESDSEGAVGGRKKRKVDDESDDEDDDDEDDDEDMEDEEAPEIIKGESANDYFSRDKDYWMDVADEAAERDGIKITTKQLKKTAFKMAEEHFNKNMKDD